MKNNSKSVILNLNLPDFKKEEIKVDILENAIDVSAYKKLEKEDKKKDFFHHETSQKSFVYHSTLPEVNSEKAKIVFSKGVLTIEIPKK